MRPDVASWSSYPLTPDRPYLPTREIGAAAAPDCPSRSLWWLVAAAALGAAGGYYARRQRGKGRGRRAVAS